MQIELNTLLKMNQTHFYTTVWIEEPGMTIIDSTRFPIEDVEFPTVTLCPQSSNTNRWGPVIKVLDYMNITCEVG